MCTPFTSAYPDRTDCRSSVLVNAPTPSSFDGGSLHLLVERRGADSTRSSRLPATIAEELVSRAHADAVAVLVEHRPTLLASWCALRSRGRGLLPSPRKE